MSLIPPFQIGVCNVWIFMVYSIVGNCLSTLIFNKDNIDALTSQSKIEKRYSLPWFILFMLTFIYSIFLPLKLGTVWFYIGLFIYLVGVIPFTITAVNLAKTPIRNEPATGGLYRYSRNPMYVTTFLMLVGAGIASASWIVILFAVISTIMWVSLSTSEEQFCLEQYGDTYREYMKRTPRWIGIPK